MGLDDERELLVSLARGDVLEVGVGTGLNLPKYKFSEWTAGQSVKTVTGIDLSPGMLEQARSKRQALPFKDRFTLYEMNVQKLDFPDAKFDTVIDTFGLCVFSDPVQALREMKRVCKPGGTILLLENSISDNKVFASYQKLTSPMVAKMGGKGCFYDQDPVDLASQAGLQVVSSRPVGAGGFFRAIITRV